MSDFINTVTIIGDEALVASMVDRTIKELADNTIQTIRGYGFSHCSALESVDLPICENTSGDAFSNCINLKNVNMPRLKSANYQDFNACTNLETLKLPSATYTSVNSFSACYKLKILDFASKLNIGNSLQQCKSLIALILRSETICSQSKGDTFSSCNHFIGKVDETYNPDGLMDGYIYVPKALIEEYKAATNWTVYADQFRALEDYTVDDTITGELDESKI